MNSSQPPSTGLLHPTLQQPLRTFMLPCLAPRALLALRQACNATQQLVDESGADLWTAIAMRLGIPYPQLPACPWDVQAVHALLHEKAALVSRVHCWEASPVELPTDLLDSFLSHLQYKLTWVWQDHHQETATGRARTLSCQFLLVQDGTYEGSPCYSSDTESGLWEVTFPATASAPSTPFVVVIEVPSGETDVICEPAGQQVKFRSNCCHAFNIDGDAHVLLGADSSSQDQLTNRIGVYELGLMGLMGPLPELQTEYWLADPEFIFPDADWQCQKTWQTEAEGASVAGHGSLLAWQTGRCSLTVIDMSSFTEVAHVSLKAVALPDSDLEALQWSSSGDHLAVQCQTAARAQLIVLATCSWQPIACREFGTRLSSLWAPTEPSLAIHDGNHIEVRHSNVKVK